jgi:hypothetical protein
VLSITTNGASVSGEFFDKDRKVVAVLRTNKFVINRLNCFDLEKGRSTLRVSDQAIVEVVNIKWINRNAFSFSGTIRSPDGVEVVITKTNVMMANGSTISDSEYVGGMVVLDFSRTNMLIGVGVP